LTLQTISPLVKSAQYAVRGELLLRAEEHEKALRKWKENQSKSPNLLPFDEVVYCNIGNPQALKQTPITFARQILALMEYPQMMENDFIEKIFPMEAIARAKKMLEGMNNGMGAYSNSQGIPFIREDVASFISKRDGYPSLPEDIFLYNGASPAVQAVLSLMIRDSSDGIMIPIPQYPLYSGSLALIGGAQVGYYLNEESNWGLSCEELERSFQEASQKGIRPRALVVINPGNPTGQILTMENMMEVIKFCYERRLVLLADEVYQENVYIGERRPWHSFKKVLRSMGSQYSEFELFSFHSVSKGFLGECGHRGGYLEVVSIDSEVKAQLYKLSSLQLCPNTVGQVLVDVMVNPPQEKDGSCYVLYIEERDRILRSLKSRAERVTRTLNTLENVTCLAAEGAMYAFARLHLPAHAVEVAKTVNKAPDTFYCLQLLDATGICVVPGSGFGQRDGTFHFRTTFLPPEEQIERVLEKIQKFNSQFMKQYA